MRKSKQPAVPTPSGCFLMVEYYCKENDMDKEAKNKIYIDKANNLADEVKALRIKIAGEFNNRECSLAITKLQETEFWLKAFAEKLKEE